MRRYRPHVGALALVAASTAVACSPLHLPLRRHHGEDLVVLLRDEGGTVGKAVVSNKAGSANLSGEGDATRVSTNRKPARPVPIEVPEIHNLFGSALSALPDAPLRFTLMFEFESDELTDEARALVPQIVTIVAGLPVPDLVVVGHTDTMGTPAANFELGMKRAVTVRNVLVDAGIDPALIEVSSLGEADLSVQTPDETPEPRNRRVDIMVR
jgi:outer membrane protein OmpA-like peptidoglycan-associated protein